MKRKVYNSPEVVINDVYTISNFALDVVIKNSDVGEGDVATKQRNETDSNKNNEDTGWGNIW
ncbi:MAG: hypothetical protein IKN83_12370 [Bacteroidaceae bacterium]|nr:hypothetical protein [Bacteroidaceae bacterium]